MTHPEHDRRAPTSFIAVDDDGCAVFPSSALSFKNLNRLATTITSPTTKSGLPIPVEKKARPEQATVSPTRNTVKLRPCPVFAAMKTPFLLPQERSLG